MSSSTTIEFWNTLGLGKCEKKDKTVSMLNLETIRKINEGIRMRMCENPEKTTYSVDELRDWQREIMEQI